MTMKTILKSDAIHIAIILALSMAVGAVAIKLLASPALYGDGQQYDLIAKAIVKDFSYPITDNYLLAPGYPVFLAVFYKFFGPDYAAIYFIQFILLGVTGSLIFLAARKFFHFSRLQALLPALTILFWPYFVNYATLLLSETLYTALLTLFVLIFLHFYHNPAKKTGAAAGAVLGLASLVRPIPLLLPWWIIFGAGILTVIAKKNSSISFIKPYWRGTAVFVAVFYLALMPWSIMASAKMHKFVPVASTAGDVYAGANKSYLNEWSYYQTPGYEPDAEVTRQKIAVIKVKNFFRFWRSGANGLMADSITNKYPAAAYLVFPYRLFFYAVIFLFFLSLLHLGKNKKILLPWLVIGYVWLLHTVLHPQPRFTLPVIPLVVLLAFFTLYNLKQITGKLIKRNPQKC